MEWKKTNISSSELEKQQQAYIKEALEMAKKSISIEKNKAEKAAAEKAAAEKAAAEKAAAEKAAAEKAAAEKAAAEKAAAEKAAAEKAAAEKAAEEIKEQEELKVKSEMTKFEKEEGIDENILIEEDNMDNSEDIIIESNENTDTIESNENTDTIESSENTENIAKEEIAQSEIVNNGEECDDGIIDLSQPIFPECNADTEKKTENKPLSQNSPNPSNPPNFDSYIRQHNQSQGGCPNCQKRRTTS